MKPVDPKTGTGNNSAKPNRPERTMDRKGRTYDKPKKSIPGTKDERTKRDGKEWGEGKMGKQVEDGVQEVLAEEATSNATTGGGDKPRRDRGGGRGREGGGRRGDREAKPELTDEEKAALEAERAAEARQMTLEEYNAKKAQADAAAAAELKEARKVEKDAALVPLKKADPSDGAEDWSSLAKKNDKKKTADTKDAAAAGKSKKGEKLIFEAARPQKVAFLPFFFLIVSLSSLTSSL